MKAKKHKSEPNLKTQAGWREQIKRDADQQKKDMKELMKKYNRDKQ